mmetsp:Transcript_68753/g.121596  ORF Transcript_68753/g.121596 Transcript_68753/m.121596 type:complete len:91 (+) Transcript_68753:122-394(+)
MSGCIFDLLSGLRVQVIEAGFPSTSTGSYTWGRPLPREVDGLQLAAAISFSFAPWVCGGGAPVTTDARRAARWGARPLRSPSGTGGHPTE